MIGAGFLQTFVIKRAKDLGYRVICVDGNPEAPGFAYADDYAVINIVNAEDCLRYAAAQTIDGVMTAATDFGVVTTAYIARELSLPGLNLEAARLVKNKYCVRKKLYEARADDAELAYEITNEEQADAIKNRLSYPVMVKPCDGSGSRGAVRVDIPEELVSACNLAMANSLSQKALVEKFITGEEYGVESFVYDGQVTVLAIMKKWMTAAPFYAELGHALPSGLNYSMERRIRTAAETAIRSLGLDFGAVNMDLLITQEGDIHIIDIGARMGGNLIGSDIVPLGTGIDYMGNLIRAAVGDAVVNTPIKCPECVATRLLTLDQGMVITLPDFSALEKCYGVKICHHLQIGDEIHTYRTNLDGCGYVVAAGDDVRDAVIRAEKVLAEINTRIIRG